MKRHAEHIPVPGQFVASRVINDRAVLLDPHEDSVSVLNEVGAFIWKLIGERRHTGRSIIEAVVAEFEVDARAAEADVLAFLEELRGRGFIAHAERETGNDQAFETTPGASD